MALSDRQHRLAQDALFIGRLKTFLAKKAFAVIQYKLAGGTVPESELTFAKLVHADPAQYAADLALYFATSTNVVAAGIVSEDDGRITCPITDAAFESQVEADWAELASA